MAESRHQVIYEDAHDWSLGPRWRVEQDPMWNGSANLVRFIQVVQCRDTYLKKLDELALWNGKRWDRRFWVPHRSQSPEVPRKLMAIVNVHMRTQTKEQTNG